MSRWFKAGGTAASFVLILFGVLSVAAAVVGFNLVGHSLKQERIVGTPDMTPSAIRAEVQKAGLKDIEIPGCSVAGEEVNNGVRANCFAQYMRVHALLATGGKTYSQMAQDDPKRDVWVSEIGFSTALSTSFFAQLVAIFALILGICLLLTGIGFLVLTRGLPDPVEPAAPPEAAPA